MPWPRGVARSHHPPIEDRFASRFVKGKGCWEWTAETNAKGYGKIKYAGKNRLAHRVAWELAHGKEIPPGMCVLHHCDNPPCVRVDHLFLGTPRDNVIDKIRKGRQMTRPPVMSPSDLECLARIRWGSRAEWERAREAHLLSLQVYAAREHIEVDPERERCAFARLFPAPPL